MSEAVSALDRSPSSTNVVTLRALLDDRARRGERFRLAEVVALVVPLCAELAALHARGETVILHPSAIGPGPDGRPHVLPALTRVRPTDPRDLAACAPELATGASSARSSVYALGAIVYEMLTLRPIGPGMQPPTQIVPGLPPIVDAILAKALVTDPAQRPDDLAAFAQAIHHFAPNSVAPPPAAAEGAFEVDIDLNTSMMPPSGATAAAIAVRPLPVPRISAPDDPFAAVDARVSAPEPPRVSNSALEELSALKARLEADVAPRWIVVKDKMDHGPFAAIELLQMIASDRFAPDDVLVDTHEGTRTPLKDHAEFSRFAHHANLKREEVREKKEVASAEKRERTAAGAKTTFGLIAVVALVSVVSFVFWRIQAQRAADERKRQEEQALNIAGDGKIAAKAQEKPKVAGGGHHAGGGFGGKSYEDALKNSVSDMDAETLSTKECAAPVSGDIAGSCGLNGSATAKIVVKNGRAQGVTVTTDPHQPGVNSCMAGRIGGLSWRSVPGVSGCIRTFKVH
jgi:hypothetical protein